MDKSLLRWLSPKKQSQTFYLGFLVIALSFFTVQTQAQSCGCQDQININLNGNCQFTVTVSNLQAGDCGDDVTIIVADTNPANGNIVDCAGRWEYGIFNSNNDLLCWGYVNAEDKAGPVVTQSSKEVDNIECTYVDLLLNNPATINPGSKYYLGRVLFQDNCASCGCSIDTKFYDEIQYPQDCNNDDVVAIMTRRWTATDCEGNQTIATQTFNFVRPDLQDLTSVADTVIQTCSPGSVTNIPEIYPYWVDVFGDRLYLDDVDCNYSANTSEIKFTVCDDGSYKLERTIRVLDWCTGRSSEIDTYIVKVGDFEAPVFTGNAQEIEGTPLTVLTNDFNKDDFFAAENAGKLPTISTNSSTCTASFFIDKASLQSLFGFGIQDCADVDINVTIYTYGPQIIQGFPVGPDAWRTTNYPMINGVASNVPVGLHALVIETDDNCKNSSTGVVLFKVKDRIPPIMKCDDELRVSVTTGNPFIPNLGAYARVDAIDVDEGSFDNCQLDKLLVRRSVEDLANCEGSFIALGYDANNDDKIDANDWYDENNNGVYDAATEYKWELVDGVWMSPWRAYSEFFCCDVDESVTIELRGWDAAKDPLTGMAMPNTNMCWLNVTIEDDIDPVISSLPDFTLNCDDPDLALLQDGTYTMETTPDELAAIRERFGAATVSGTDCGATTIVETITTNMDPQCPSGTITRTVQVSKTTDLKGTSSTSVSQTIHVVVKHDYSICFPADVIIDCNDPDADIPGVTINAGDCDLFAQLTPEDMPFFPVNDGNGDNGCYKIFRTYKIINWCEYDGISEPVIVGRDWDGDNNTNPKNPDGDDLPGDEGICVIVVRDFIDGNPDTTWYDRDTDPYNNIPGTDNAVSPNTQGYWWRVISGSNDPDDPDYYDGPFDNDFSGSITAGEESVWKNDKNDNGSADDDDYIYGSNGFWQYTQHIKVLDQTPPEITVIGLDSFCSNSNLDCAGDVLFTVSATDNCTATEDLGYSVFLDVDNDGLGLVNVTNSLINGTFSARYPIGTHRLVFQVNDVCGTRSGVEEKIFTVYDCLAPTPVCSEKLVVNLMSVEDGRTAISEVWATDFTQSTAVGDCSGQGPDQVSVGGNVFRPEVTKFSINRVGEAYHPDSAGVTVTCADVDQLVPVEVHAIDEAGNHGFCTTFIDVQDNSNLCPAGATQAEIAGIISTENGDMMEDVEVRLSGPVSMNYMTDQNGQFKFANLETNYDYSVEPKKDIDHRNGVSIVDLIQIKRHVLGYEALSSPYQQIAADVNHSGDITVKDLIEVQRMILHKIDKFEDNTSWRFVDKNYSFSGTNALANNFPESISHNNLKRSKLSTDFVAVKTGDTNESAGNGAQAAQPRSNAEALEVYTSNKVLKAGEEYSFFLTANLNGFIGAQFTTSLSANVELVDVTPALLGESQIGVFTDKGMITAAWNNLENTNLNTQQLFGITIRARADVQLSDIIQINSRLTTAESVKDDKKDAGTVILKVGDISINPESQFIVQAGQPNPFRDETVLRYQLPKDMKVQFSISDINGKVLFRSNMAANQGENQITFRKDIFPAVGVYFLNVTAEEFTATQKLIRIE